MLSKVKDAKDLERLLGEAGNATELENVLNKLPKGTSAEGKTYDALKTEAEGAGGGARFGERKISNQLYSKLRKGTPTDEIRDMVNEGHVKGSPDPVLPGKFIDGVLEADHIVSMERITRMEGFELLTEEQQLQILNYEPNFIGLSKSANASKGSQTFLEWMQHCLSPLMNWTKLQKQFCHTKLGNHVKNQTQIFT
ncbi:MAG: hypothetical protein HY064_14355 [Bacteroidetes bacterium]|nr:hypothetical protein [Bacteroidota bacterium]